MTDDILKSASEDELKEALIFARNFKKPGKGFSAVTEEARTTACNENCDCYGGTMVTRAAGIAGYHFGS
ncbi:hypothetical protein [Hoeflea sp.]|uniref:hypothetical protein n=1 Tax=Hoeflea sp. TaxID=1940281 RepID=UPI001993F263|nr:hypothetical protein [Hoeflea sp.]MBC7281239.1 hypothetical protein [Hoeflea sp.]